MHHRRYEEDAEQRNVPAHFTGGLARVEFHVDILVEPVVYHTVPRAVEAGVRGGVPPVLVEHSVGESHHLREGVHPRVEHGEEGAQ